MIAKTYELTDKRRNEKHRYTDSSKVCEHGEISREHDCEEEKDGKRKMMRAWARRRGGGGLVSRWTRSKAGLGLTHSVRNTVEDVHEYTVDMTSQRDVIRREKRETYPRTTAGNEWKAVWAVSLTSCGVTLTSLVFLPTVPAHSTILLETDFFFLR